MGRISSILFIVDQGFHRFLSDMHRASPILLEMDYWDVVFCVWASLAIIVVLSISMA